MEVKQFGIDVVIIKPGAILTEWNTIAREKLLEVSGGTDYKAMATKHAKLMATSDKSASLPIVVAKTIVRSVVDRRPKTRYATGGGAKIILFVRRILSDRMFDRLVLSLLK